MNDTLHDDGVREDEPIIIYARWAGYAGDRSRLKPTASQEMRTHTYSASIPPEMPLRIGSRVRILATTPAWYTTPEEDPDTYDAYDAHVVGPVTRVVGWKGRKVILEVVNECAVNPVKTARVRMPYVPEVTVLLNNGSTTETRREAQETDLNTEAVVRVSPADALCGASVCWTPWRRLVGEDFLWETMEEDVGERPGARGGRRRIPKRLTSWKEAAEAKPGRGGHAACEHER